MKKKRKEKKDLLGHKKDREESSMHVPKRQKLICKNYILYDSKYMTFWERLNYRDSKKITGCQGFGLMEG